VAFVAGIDRDMTVILSNDDDDDDKLIAQPMMNCSV